MGDEKLPSAIDNHIEEAVAINNPNMNFVTCLYKAKIANIFRFVNATWSKNLMSHSLSIAVENPCDEEPYTCKIDLKTWQFWGKKGLKSFKVEDEQHVDIYWDFRSAKFSSSPEPSSDYYVALVSNKEVVLLLGDQKNEAFRRVRSGPCSEDALMLQKKECVFGKKVFCANTMLGKGEKEHVIVIETSLYGGSDPEMWIGVDGIELIRLSNLHWRFRGSESITIDDVPVLIFWDVHDWLYSSSGFDSGPAMFIFARGTLQTEANRHQNGAFDELMIYNEDSLWELPLTMDMCHFLYAWMAEC